MDLLGHASNSSEWGPTMASKPGQETDPDCAVNPDFCTWSQVFIPYCTGDMHSGTQMERNPGLGNYYFSGHNAIAGVTADLKGRFNDTGQAPTHFLISGSSAGGIGALMHTDFFAEEFPSAVVKGAPQCGFFYAGVTAVDDVAAHRPTPAANLGFISGWKPYMPTACMVATNGDVAQCTDAHCAISY